VRAHLFGSSISSIVPQPAAQLPVALISSAP
jgi:hypothetical protein